MHVLGSNGGNSPVYTRLISILAQLPESTTPRVLNVGCGVYHSASTLRQVHPAWQLYGLDRDRAVLRAARSDDPDLRLIEADARSLPGLLHAQFGLILVRHPDLFRSQKVWQSVLQRLPELLAPDGALLVTVYAPDEVDLLCSFGLPPALPLDEDLFASVNIVGQDRHVFAWKAGATVPER